MYDMPHQSGLAVSRTFGKYHIITIYCGLNNGFKHPSTAESVIQVTEWMPGKELANALREPLEFLAKIDLLVRGILNKKIQHLISQKTNH